MSKDIKHCQIESARMRVGVAKESANVVSPVALVEVVANCRPAVCRVHLELN